MSSRLRETIAECLFFLNSGSSTDHLGQATSDVEVQKRALQTLSSLTAVSPLNRNLVAQTGVVSTLLNLSRSSSPPTIQFLSLSILFRLSLNSNLKPLIADMEMIHHLNSLIIFQTCPDSGKMAASLIYSLAMLDKNKAVFGVAGTVQALVKSLEYQPTCINTHHVLSSLAELVQFHGNSTLAVRAGAVPVPIQVVRCNDGELAGTALSILVLLGRLKEGIHAIRNTEDILSLMVDVMKRRCMMSKEGSADLLPLFEENEGCIKSAVEFPDFSSLVADLSVRGSAKARGKASLILKKIMEVNSDSYSESSVLYI
ncbi:U-box domain-containing protein 11-like isoform X1 [Papaver somniferum]|uniref:U-box domain-containing protein 11-like isoform X1 n=1 Tax=Papaver somniferum TaxID=3469 RepID=UPI000E702B47|nr:U-box domain-containing protein 11-like isoform X1 [Papaver somniferum]